MLVLTLSESGTLKIGPDIEVQILQIRGRQVRIGITAPKEIPICRGDMVKNAAGEVVNPKPERRPEVNYRRKRRVVGVVQ